MLETWGWVGGKGRAVRGRNLSLRARTQQIRMTVLHEWEVVRVTVCARRQICVRKAAERFGLVVMGFFGNGVVVIITHNKHSALVIPCHITGMLVTEMLSAWVNG